MAIEIKLHAVQAKILRELLFKPRAKFSELNVDDLTNDHFTFHIKQLFDLELLNKTGDGKYELTIKGKEFANRLDTDKVEIERQAKIGALVVAIKGEGKNKKYLLQKRLKQPYFGFYGFVTGKVKWGETAKEAARRELKEETGLTANVVLAGIKHKMDYAEAGQLLEDKFFFVFKAENIKGKLIEKFEGGENSWQTEEEIFNTKDLFTDIRVTMDIVKKENIAFTEKKYKVEKY